MRLRYFILTLTIVTLFSLAYTWQQIEIIKLAYQENHKNKIYKELLDINHSLRYNLISLKSSSHLGGRLLVDDKKFEIPRKTQVKVLALPKEKVDALSPREVFIRKGIFLSVFKAKDSWPIMLAQSYIGKQAEAQDFTSR